MHKNCLFIIAASGSAQKDSRHASYKRSEYLWWPRNSGDAVDESKIRRYLTFDLECEVLGQSTAFMVTPEKEQAIGETYLQ